MPAVAAAGGLPTRLGKYELLMPLAAGGMARIYIGRSTGIGSFERHVVLKLITPERANDHTAVQMFLDEARLAASLNHQNVAQVFEVGEDSGIHYLAMEYVHGQDMRAVLAKAGSAGMRIPLELALTVVAGAAAGLHHAHERRGADGQPLGIVHRDVSPSNIMIGYDGAVKLLDFGIAKATSRSVETQSGVIKGKFAYMAPEQCRGREVDRRSDVFSLGIILYEVTTQHRCFRADSDFDTMHRIVTGDIVRPTRLIPNYPQALEAIVMKALAIDPPTRYQSAGQLLEALENFAVSARMSLSTMSLGRFMRETFGEVPEPWLLPQRNPPIEPRENTISSTNSRSSADQQALRDRMGEIPDADARFPDSGGVAAQTVLDLPRGTPAEPEPGNPEWSARSYPAMPGHAQPGMPSSPPAFLQPPNTPARGVQTPGATIPTHAVPPPPQVPRTTEGQHPLAHVPAGSQPMPPVGMPAPPSGQFSPNPGSHSGVSAAMPAAYHDLSYPRYEPPPADAMDEPDVQLRPNRRPWIIGGVLAVTALVIALVIGRTSHRVSSSAAPADDAAAAGGSAAPEQPASGSAEEGSAAPTGSAAPASAAAASAAAAKPIPSPSGSPSASPSTSTNPSTAAGSAAPAAGSAAPVDDTISIHIVSIPPGAQVVLGGKKLGKTPLDKKLPRGNKLSQLTIHLDGYTDVVEKIDLGGDYSNDHVQLVKPEPAETHTHEVHEKHGEKSTSHGHAQTHKAESHGDKAAGCQPPGRINPFDTRPVCTK